MRKAIDIDKEVWQKLKEQSFREGKRVMRFGGDLIARQLREIQDGTHTPKNVKYRKFLEAGIVPGCSMSLQLMFDILDEEFGITERKFQEIQKELRLSSQWSCFGGKVWHHEVKK